jgi:magnesium chelatase family protein
VQVPRVDYEMLSDNRLVESSAAVRAWVEKERDRQLERFKNSGLARNSDIGQAEAIQYRPIMMNGG